MGSAHNIHRGNISGEGKIIGRLVGAESSTSKFVQHFSQHPIVQKNRKAQNLGALVPLS